MNEDSKRRNAEKKVQMVDRRAVREAAANACAFQSGALYTFTKGSYSKAPISSASSKAPIPSASSKALISSASSKAPISSASGRSESLPRGSFPQGSLLNPKTALRLRLLAGEDQGAEGGGGVAAQEARRGQGDVPAGGAAQERRTRGSEERGCHCQGGRSR